VSTEDVWSVIKDLVPAFGITSTGFSEMGADKNGKELVEQKRTKVAKKWDGNTRLGDLPRAATASVPRWARTTTE